MEIFLNIALSLIVGLIVGACSGLLGIGGGTLMVPVFKLAFGLPAIASTATSLFVIVPTSISGTLTHLHGRTCIPLLGLCAGLGGALTSPLGVYLASISPEWGIIVCAALVIVYSAFTMLTKAERLRKANKALNANTADELQKTAQDSKIPQADELALFMNRTPKSKIALVGILAGASAGVLSGYVGVGGGFIMVPLFMQFLSTPMKLTSGTSLIAVMILAIPGTITQAILGNIVWTTGIFMTLGCIPGAVIGSKMISKVPELQLRYGFACFLLVAALMLFINQFVF